MAVPPLVTVVVPSLGNVTSTVSLTGQISAQNDMPIGVEGDGGRISAVLVEPGDHVRRGQVLARLNPLTAQSQVDGAEATLDELRASAAASQAEYARAEGARDSFSAEEFERRRTVGADRRRPRSRPPKRSLSEAHTRWQRTTVVAPSDGIVLTRAAEVGQIAMPGTAPLFRLARGGEIEMRGQVAEQDMPRLKVGQTALVRLDGVAQPFTGKVWQIGAIIDAVTRQGTVRISLPAADQNLRPGAFARAEIQAGATVGVILPQTAVLSDEQGSYTLIVGADDKVERRAITVAGAHAEGLLVSSGLTRQRARGGDRRRVPARRRAGAGGAGQWLAEGGAGDTGGKRSAAGASGECRGERAVRRISAWAITHPVFPLVLFAVLTVFGIVAFVRMPITLNPDVSAPFVHVFIGVPGAAPTEIETQVLQKVEGSVSKIGNVKNIISRATEGQAMVFVEFQIGTPVDRATTDVRDAVARVRSDLPQGILEPQRRARGDRRRADRLLRGQHHRHDRGAALLVRRRHDQQAPAGGPRRGAGQSLGWRRSRDPRRPRSGAHAVLRHHRGRSQRPAAAGQHRRRRRPRAGGRERAVDPRARQRAHRAATGRHSA